MFTYFVNLIDDRGIFIITTRGIIVYIIYWIIWFICFILLAVSLYLKKVNLIIPLIIIYWIRGILPVFNFENRTLYKNDLDRNYEMLSIILVNNGNAFLTIFLIENKYA